MAATCVPRYVPHSSTGLSKHGDRVFPHFCPLNQNVAHVRTRGGGCILPIFGQGVCVGGCASHCNAIAFRYHGLIFVYGQTGTGKTYTLCCQEEGNEGILYNSVVEIFARIQQDRDHEYECSLQFVQIYNEVRVPFWHAALFGYRAAGKFRQGTISWGNFRLSDW